MTFNSKFLIAIITTSSILASISCTNESHDNDKETPTEIAEEHNDAKFNGEEENKADYLVDVAASNLSIIKLSELAEQQTTNAKVKIFATKMIAEHKKISAKINGLAATKKVTIPEDMAYTEADGYKDISGESGVDFDRDYIDQITNQHQDFINKIDTTNSDYKDNEVKIFMDDMIPKLRNHVDEAINLKKSLENIKK